MADYVAYHSSELMGREYWPREQCKFFSRKAESFLRRAIGGRAWVIASVRIDRRMVYRLAELFTPSEVRAEADGSYIIGAGTPFRPPFEVTALPWFAELLKEQNQFSYGFNPIRSENIIVELTKLLEQYGGESVLQPDEVTIATEFFEGARRQVSSNRYERNPVARAQCIEHYGCRCSVCDFDFEKAYGERGAGFIHVHHLKLLSEIGEEYQVDPIADLRPVCPNCHAMIHYGGILLSIEELRAQIQRAKKLRLAAPRAGR